MFEITLNGENRLDLHISGKIDSETMERGLEEYIEKSKSIENVVMLYIIEDIDVPTLGAIGVELSKLPRLFGLIRKFDRVAVLANQRWVQKVSEIEGFFMPGLEIKAFDRDAKEEAEAWLEG